MKRTTVFLAPAQISGLAEAGKQVGLCSAQLVRIAINEWLSRRKRQLKK
ncbi:MAG TPA: hypothetical protein VNV41_07560 [Candidatus Acidoferrales bacterium]|jgi:hypothetical protein|nr:hypothetical protein [Candidatus Acidoferrales bacterium]